MSTPRRATMSLRPETYERALRLRTELSAAEGRNYQMTDIIDRAVRCLEEVQSRSAWTVPNDRALQAEQHIATLATSALSQFINIYMPDKTLVYVGVHYDMRAIGVYIAGEGEVRRIVLAPQPEGSESAQEKPERSAQGRRTTVSLRHDTHELAQRLHEEFSAADGRTAKMTQMTETIDRAVRCLEEVLTRSAWTAPRTSALPTEQHTAMIVTNVLSEFVSGCPPDAAVGDVTFTYDQCDITVHIDGQPQWKRIYLAPKPAYLDPTEPVPERYPEGRRHHRQRARERDSADSQTEPKAASQP